MRGSWWWVKQNKQMALVLITITMILQLQIKGCVGCLETERIGLLQLKSYLKNVLNAKEDIILKSWSNDPSNSDCCLWERVKCSDVIGGRIVHLSLNQIMPIGDQRIWHESPILSLNLSLLHSFPRLKTLDFSYNEINHLFDPIHGYKSFQRLENLRTLDLYANLLNNSVLPFLSAARSLRTLNLGGNKLGGVFPPNGYKSFQRLEKLRTLDLSINRLNNSVLPFLSAARSLRTLNLGDNELEGVFPPNELANMTELKVLNLQLNQFSSFSVQGLINLRELEVLDLSFNRINDVEACDGEKKFRMISECVGAELRTTKLKTLDLSYNNFLEAALLKGLENLVELKVLSLAHNNFNHTRSIEVLKDMPKLQEMDLTDNEFIDLDSLGLVFPSSLQVLNLRRNQLSSTLKGNSKICALMNLRELGLRGNALTSMPSCLGNLSRLRTLDLSENQLNGNVSSFVYGLPSTLEYLSLLDNNFNGSFLFSSLVNHTRLTVFKLSSKVGMIQAKAESSWVPLFQLKRLKLQNVILGSTIPGFFIHQHDLCFIDISYSHLTGAFPTWLVQNNTRLKTLLLNSNSLTKLQLPWIVHGLQGLDISSNRIQNSIQEDIGIVFPKLRFMYFSSNHFHGTMPSSVGEMKSLETLDVSSNRLSGQLPKTFLSSCYSLKFLMLSNNQFQGSLGKGLLNSKQLRFLDVSDNSFSGALPHWIGRMSNLRHLNMSGNQLRGPFPRHLSRLEVIDISRNSFSGSIPRNVDFPSLVELRLQSNKFMGSIPNTLFKAERLEVLDLRNNNFSGMILNTIGDISSLLVLLLRNNSFQSHIPEKICQLSNVGLLDLSHNKFNGVIPSCLGNMSFSAEGYRTVSDLPSGIFTGLPRCQYASHLDLEDGLFDNGSKIIVDFFTKNRYETYQGDILTYMYGLDLSSNELSGEIPVEIGDLQYIRSLNLSSNRFTDSIPDSISKLKDLESLDLSNNKLDGKIPPQLADLDNLGYLNVSWNNLSGEIPLNGHLLTFGEMSYIGNAHLCGLPINKSCNPVPEPSASKHAKEEEEEGDGVIDMVWFYWTCGAVYISTLLALSAFLCIDSRWSREWFYRVDLLVHHLQRFKDRFVFN